MIAALTVDELKARFRGELIAPGDQGYDAARAVFNAMIDRRPALIARCASREDVIQAVKFAREQTLPVSVRCTGHNVGGYAVCDDGIVIDLSRSEGDRGGRGRANGPGAGGVSLGRRQRRTPAPRPCGHGRIRFGHRCLGAYAWRRTGLARP